MGRKKIAAGNWKMNTSVSEGIGLASELMEGFEHVGAEMIISPPFIHLASIVEVLSESAIMVAAQNCHQEASGAYTGEVAAPMLKGMGVDYVIIGHSERREYFNEDADLLKAKVDAVLLNNLGCIFCCGEPLSVREAGGQNQMVEDQIVGSLGHLTPEQMAHVTIAYEPVWAIGTGVTASPAQAQEMHAHIRGLLQSKFGAEVADQTSILYGGSVKPGNADELFGQPDVDGGLVGGASLKANDFLSIANSLSNS